MNANPYSPGCQSLRELFPSTEYKVYLNHAGCSPFSLNVKKALDDYTAESAGELIEDYRKNLAVREELRGRLAGLVNAESDQIAIVKNTSAGLSLLASGLEWKSGDRIILIDQEFPSNIYPFMNCGKHGAEIDFVPSRTKRNGVVLLEDIERLITPKTKLLSISFVEFSNGFRNDLKAIGDLCERHGIIFCVDGIQGLGALELDVQSCRIGFLASAGHKWLMGPQGIGFIYVRPDILERLAMTQVGWLSVKDAWNFFDYRLDWEDGAKRFESGTENWPGVYGLNAAVGLLQEISIARIEKHVLELTSRFIQQAEENDLKIISSVQEKHRSGIVSFRYPDDPSSKRTEALFEFLLRKKIITAFREGNIRVSPHGYNDEQDIKRLSAAIIEFKATAEYT